MSLKPDSGGLKPEFWLWNRISISFPPMSSSSFSFFFPIQREAEGLEIEVQVGSHIPPYSPRHLHVLGSAKTENMGHKLKPRIRQPESRQRKSARIYNQSPGGIHLPFSPTVHQCWVHFYMTHVTEAQATHKKYKDDYVVKVDNVTELARDFAWQMSGKYWFGGRPLDCMARILLLEEQKCSPEAKKIWYLGTPYSVQVGSHIPPYSPRHLHVLGSAKTENMGHKLKPRIRQPESRQRKSARIYNQSPGGIHLPFAPTVHQCWVHFYMTHVTEAQATHKKYKDDYVVKVDNVTELARDFAWQMSGKYWFGGRPLDCMARILLLEEQKCSPEAKKIWYLGTPYSIALPIYVEKTNYFIILLSFDHKKIYILDSRGRNSVDLTLKMELMHQSLVQKFPNDYANNFDIRMWPRELVLENVPTQGNSWDCGPYVCFFMKHIRDLIPNPRVAYKVTEPYLRIWIANYIGDNCYNSLRRDLLEGCKNFRKNPENQAKFEELYKNIYIQLDNGKEDDSE